MAGREENIINMVENGISLLANFIDTNRNNINGWFERMSPDFKAQGYSDDEIQIVALSFCIKEKQEKLVAGNKQAEVLEGLQEEVKSTDLYRSALGGMIGIKQ